MCGSNHIGVELKRYILTRKVSEKYRTLCGGDARDAKGTVEKFDRNANWITVTAKYILAIDSRFGECCNIRRTSNYAIKKQVNSKSSLGPRMQVEYFDGIGDKVNIVARRTVIAPIYKWLWIGRFSSRISLAMMTINTILARVALFASFRNVYLHTYGDNNWSRGAKWISLLLHIESYMNIFVST